MLRRTFLAAALLFSIALPVQAEVKLEHRPQRKEGDKATELVNTMITQVLTLGGQDIETNFEQLIQVSEVVGKQSDDGSLPVKQKFDTFRMQMGLPGGINVNFDSAKPDDAESPIPQLQEVIDLMKQIAKATWTVTYNKDHRIDKIEYDGNPFADLPEKFKSEVDPERAKEAANQVFDRLPGKVVKAGESWKRTEKMNIGSGQTLEFEHEFTYEGPTQVGGKTLHKINQKALTVKYNMQGGNAQPVQISDSKLKVESSTGHMLYDPALGTLTHSEAKIRIAGTLTASIGGQDLKGELDLTIETRADLQ